jgi:PIN domain nuclease of toxin-antitoxin system
MTRISLTSFLDKPFSAIALGITAVYLEHLNSDPADRMIVATALLREAVLLTADRKLLEWSGKLDRQDARL